MPEVHRRPRWFYAMLGSPLVLPIGSISSSLAEQQGLDPWSIEFLQLFGCVLGAVIAGVFAQRFGSKHAILAEGLIFTATFASSCFTFSSAATVLDAFLNGICMSGVVVALIEYYVEIGQWYNRGRLCAAVPLFYCVGLLIQHPLSDFKLLVYRIIVQLIFSVLLLLFYCFAPETPQFLMSRSKWEQAELSLKMLRSSDCNEELREIHEAVTSAKQSFKIWLFPILIFICTNLSGFHVAIRELTHNIDIDHYVNYWATYVSPVMGSLITFLFIDRVGRKFFLIISTSGILASELLVAIFMYTKSFDQFPGLVLATITILHWFFWMGLAGAPYIISAELMVFKENGLFLGVAVAVGWLVQYLIFLLYDHLFSIIGNRFFLLFPLVNMLALTFYRVYIPETVSKTVKQLTTIFDDNK